MTVRKIKRILTAFVFCLILSASTIPVCASAVSASNEETGYVYVLDDSADFLTDSQENSLQKQLYDLTAYCNVAFVTTTEHSKSSTEDFAADYFDDVFGPHANGTIFVIDRCLNEIYLYSDGQAHKIITNSRARSITDNTYTYARDKDYYTCAYKVFAQIETLMQGKRIAEPMRYLCSALLAIVAALFLNLFFALWSSRSHKADRRQVMTGLYAQMQIHNPRTQFIRQTRTYSPVSSGSSGGGHSGGGGSTGGSTGGTGGGNSYGSAIVGAAQSQLGVPYVWGGTTPGVGLDCSGLTSYCWQAGAGIWIGRNTTAQYASAQWVGSVGQAQPGDVLYTSGHVAIAASSGGYSYIHAPQPGEVVCYSSRSWWDPFTAALRWY